MKLQTPRNSVTVPSPPLSFSCEPGSGRAVRRYVRSRVIEAGRPGLTDEAEAVAAELFANAVQAQLRQRITTVISVQASVDGYAVTLEVYDHAEGGPFLRDITRAMGTAENGRGMHMVNYMTQGHWKWERRETGKVVTAVITHPVVLKNSYQSV